MTTVMAPCAFVVRMRAPAFPSAASVEACGCPNLFRAPAEITATRGLTAASHAGCDEVQLP